MTSTFRVLAALALAAAAGPLQAQSAADACPSLPADSGLTWEYKAAASTQFCRALRADGSEAFGLYIAKDSAFKPGRANRAEEGSIDGRAVTWSRSELAGRPDVQARETVVPLPDGRVAYLWIQARSEQELGESLSRTNALRFGPAARLSSN